MIDLLSTTDAQVWAREFDRIVNENDIDLTDGHTVEDLMIDWFANAFAAAEINQTAVEAIDHARNRFFFHQVTNGGDVGYHEFFVATMRLDEAQMWFTKGLALAQGKFNPADLEREDA